MNRFKLKSSGRWLLLLSLGVLFMCTSTFAQEVEAKISGKVVSVKGEPIVGATVTLKGTTKGTSTDTHGVFTLNSKSSDIVVITYLGYKTKEIAASRVKGTAIVLEEDAMIVDDVVVVGYGVRKRESLTGSISNISSKDLLTTTHSSLAQNLQGKIPGLQIRQNSGEPGDFNTMINIRGFGDPLYVIDGIPSDMGGNDFQRLNPQDIESISIIKDASSAIYGLRAANGVVIVTTKKGTKGKPKFNYNMVYGWQQPTDMPRMANRREYSEMINEANLNAGIAPKYTPEELAREIAGPTTDWYGMTLRDFSTQQQHNISASGGSDNVTYFLSLGYVSDVGLLKSGDLNYDKYTFRSNLTAKLAKNFKAEVNVSGRYDTKNSPSQGFHNIFYGTRTALPNSPVYANDNPEYLNNQQFLNPAAIASSDISGYTENKNKMLNSSLSLSYDVPFVKGLSLKATGSYSNSNIMDKTLNKAYNLYTYTPDGSKPYLATKKNDPSLISNGNSSTDMVTLQGYIVYSTRIAKNHAIDATLVYEQHSYKNRTSYLSREYAFYTNDQINLANENKMKNSGMEEEQTNASIIGRLNYAFKDKYLIEYAFRYDGSYRYHPDRRWGFFPVVSAGWRVSEESFLKGNKVINNLKLRGSFGIVGQDAGDPFQYVPGYSLDGTGGGYEFVNGTWTDGVASPLIVNENLTWTKSRMANIGIDVGLFSNKLTFEFDVYRRDRKGTLATRNLTLPNTFGATLPQENLNSDRVVGMDMAIGYINHIGEFHYGVRANLNFARTMQRYYERGEFANSMDKWRNGVSNRWNDMVWGYVLDGQFQNGEEIIYAPIQGGAEGNQKLLPGDYRFKDLNNDGIIDGKDTKPLFYNGAPKLYYGITLSAEYKGFDLNAVLQGSGKYTVRFREVYAEVFAFNLNTPAYFHDRWHRSDPYDSESEWIPGKWPATRLVNAAGPMMYAESEVWRKDASYLRLKSLELGYTLPLKVVKSVGIESLRIFFTAHNVFTITDPFVKPFDPEKIEGANSSGFTYPVTRSYNIGVNINF